MAINTEIPPWLTRNWQAKEPFDITPWLAERYRRNVQAQEIPLRLQHLALANQSAQLDIAHQGMVNDVQADELRQVRDEQPLMAQWMKETQGRPDLILNSPTPAVMSQRNQQVILNARKMAADSAFGRAMALQETAKVQRLTQLINRGGELPEPIKDPATGAMTYRDADISAAERAVDEREQQQWLERIQAQTQWHTDTFGRTATPEVQVIGGEHYIVNPKTGHFEKLNKAPSKEQFIASNIVKWAADHLEDAATAAKQLGDIYEQTIRPSGAGAASAPTLPSAPPSAKPAYRMDPATGKIVPVP